MPKHVELMKKREKEILKALLYFSEKTNNFTKPALLMIGGYALRAFISFSRYTRDCDFILQKKNGWHIDELHNYLPSFSIEYKEKKGSYGYMRCIKFVKHDKAKIKVAIDFIEGEIRGREDRDVIIIDEKMIKKRKFVKILIAGESVRIAVPCYVDYFIMKVISCRASDIRDIASLIYEKGIPKGLEKRIKEILPYPEIFMEKLRKIINEIKKPTFLDSWRGVFGTKEYSEQDKKKIIEILEKYTQI